MADELAHDPHTMTVGRFSVTRVIEWVGLLMPRSDMAPDATEAQWAAITPHLPIATSRRSN